MKQLDSDSSVFASVTPARFAVGVNITQAYVSLYCSFACKATDALQNYVNRQSQPEAMCDQLMDALKRAGVGAYVPRLTDLKGRDIVGIRLTKAELRFLCDRLEFVSDYIPYKLFEIAEWFASESERRRYPIVYYCRRLHPSPSGDSDLLTYHCLMHATSSYASIEWKKRAHEVKDRVERLIKLLQRQWRTVLFRRQQRTLPVEETANHAIYNPDSVYFNRIVENHKRKFPGASASASNDESNTTSKRDDGSSSSTTSSSTEKQSGSLDSDDEDNGEASNKKQRLA